MVGDPEHHYLKNISRSKRYDRWRFNYPAIQEEEEYNCKDLEGYNPHFDHAQKTDDDLYLCLNKNNDITMANLEDLQGEIRKWNQRKSAS